jgi:outer membrane protein OmpA-like peptidoglycan-associated protein
MKNSLRISALLCLVIILSGCGSYSKMVNSFAPPKQKSAITDQYNVPDNTTADKLAAASPFCPIPEQKIQEVYMVMPEDGDKVGTVDVIFNDGKEAVLHGDYSAMTLAGDEKKAFLGNEAQLKELFGTAVDALPKAPKTSLLYFLLGADQLTPESKKDAELIYSDFAGRDAPEVLIVGHTDTTGPGARNEALSIKRAERVRKLLIARGITATNIQVSGMGERNLLVETPDNTKEPKNRRVEITVR